MKNRGKLLSPLGKHLLLLVVTKVLILYCLWYTLIRLYKVLIDVIRVYSTQIGEYQKESNYDRR